MFNGKSDPIDNTADANELVGELSKSTSEAARALRRSTRLDVRVKVFVEPASLSARTGVRLQGVTGDVSVGGTQVLLARPILVGDVYQVSFDRAEFDLAPVYAVCLRARQVRPDAFEAGLRFLEQIELPQEAAAEQSALI